MDPLARSDISGMAGKSKTTQAFQFEKVMKELEVVVDRLEQGEAPLEQSLKDFEKGVTLVEQLRKQLDQAQRRIEEIAKKEEAMPEDE